MPKNTKSTLTNSHLRKKLVKHFTTLFTEKGALKPKKKAKALGIVITQPKHRTIVWIWLGQPLAVTGIPVSGKAVLQKAIKRMMELMFPAI